MPSAQMPKNMSTSTNISSINYSKLQGLDCTYSKVELQDWVNICNSVVQSYLCIYVSMYGACMCEHVCICKLAYKGAGGRVMLEHFSSVTSLLYFNLT